MRANNSERLIPAMRAKKLLGYSKNTHVNWKEVGLTPVGYGAGERGTTFMFKYSDVVELAKRNAETKPPRETKTKKHNTNADKEVGIIVDAMTVIAQNVRALRDFNKLMSNVPKSIDRIEKLVTFMAENLAGEEASKIIASMKPKKTNSETQKYENPSTSTVVVKKSDLDKIQFTPTDSGSNGENNGG